MTTVRTDGSGVRSGAGWSRGVLVLLAVLELAALVPAVGLLLLWVEPGWATAAVATGVLVAWAVVIAYLRTGPEGPE
jgi:hypothetical protein